MKCDTGFRCNSCIGQWSPQAQLRDFLSCALFNARPRNTTDNVHSINQNVNDSMIPPYYCTKQPTPTLFPSKTTNTQSFKFGRQYTSQAKVLLLHHFVSLKKTRSPSLLQDRNNKLHQSAPVVRLTPVMISCLISR